MRYITPLIFLAMALALSPAHAQEAADLLLTNGYVYTVDEDQPEAEAVAVRGNEIVFVGSADDAADYVGDSTDVIDLDGKMVLPGYISAHDHLVGSAWTTQGVDLNGARNKEETFDLIREYVAANPDLPIILGQGYNPTLMGGFPTAAELDEIVPDKVAIILDFTIHNAWMNTKAMEAGNVTKDTPDPTPGVSFFVRDEDGNPLGVAQEGAWFPTYIAVAWDAEDMIRESRAKLQSQAAAGGMTTALVPGVVTPNFTNVPAMFSDLEIAMKVVTEAYEAGDLPIRNFVQPVYKDASADPVKFAQRARELADRYNGDVVRVHGVKLHTEGSFVGKGVLMLEPFEGTDDYGSSVVPPPLMKEVVLAANAVGLDVFAHVEGSGSVRAMIDAILASREAGNTDERNALHHYQVVDPDDGERMVEYHFPANVTPIFSTDWGGQDEDYLKLFGEERVRTQVGQYRKLADAGNKLSLAGDYPSSPMSNNSMLYQIYGAITFKDALDPANSEAFPPGVPPLDLEQAIEAVTINPAWQLRMENKLGSIEVDKLADLVILDRNIMELDVPEELLETKVLATMMDGEFRFRDGL